MKCKENENSFFRLIQINLLFFLFFFPQIILSRQEMRFERITPEKGFPGVMVYSILQDYQGFMWFATMSGLIKYDGYKFTTYRYDKSDTNTLRGYNFHCLYEDKSKNLWIGGSGVLSRYNREKDNFENYFLEIIKRQPAQVIHSICEDDSANLYLGVGKYGFYGFNTKIKTFENFGLKNIVEPHFRSGWTGSLCRDENIIWLVQSDGLLKFNMLNHTFQNYMHIPGNRNSLSSDNTYCMIKDASNILWIGTFNGLNKFDISTGRFEVFGINDYSTGILNNTDILHIAEPENGKLWMLTSEGLFIFDKDKGLLYDYYHEPENPYSLSTNFLWYTYKDKSGIIWVGTQFGGLNKYNPEQSKFTHYKHDEHSINSITGGYVRALLEDREGYIWVGTMQGLNKFNIITNEVTRFQVQTPGKKTISDNNISALCEDREGNIWIGTLNGLNCLDIKSGNFIRYMHNNNDSTSLGHQMISQLYEDKHGVLWIATQGGGLDRFNKEQKSFTHYKPVFSDTNSISSESVESFFEDKSGNLWIGSWRGLNKFDRDKGIFKVYNYSESGVEPLLIPFEDKKNRFWTVSWQTGLSLFDRNSGSYILSFGIKEGFPSNTATNILEDDAGNLWVGTINGLTKYNPETGKFINYDVTDGLPFDMIWHESQLKDRQGYLYFGGEGGFFRFHPDSLEENNSVPQIVFTDFKIFNEPVKLSDEGPLKENINVTKQLNLTYKDEIFSLEFASLDYRNPAKNQYAYILEGFNKDWVYTNSANRIATYTTIDPGEYVFRVKGSNNDGLWNETGVSIKIIITPPWWATWWFRTIAIIFILGVSVFAVKLRFKALRNEKKQQEDFTRQIISAHEDERNRISRGLHDSLGQNLLIVKNLALLGKKHPEKNPELFNNIEKLSSAIIREVRDISYNLYPYQLERLGLTKALESITERALKSSEIKFTKEIDTIDNIFSHEEEINIFRVVQECINNIVKHSGAKRASLKIKKPGRDLLITISDNGKGFDVNEILSDKSKTGIGLINMKERLKLLAGTLEIKSAPGKGTKFKIKIPLIEVYKTL